MNDDPITLFLCYMCNKENTVRERAAKIRKCAKYLNSITKDKTFKSALKAIRNNKDDHAILLAVERAVENHFKFEEFVTTKAA